MSIVRRVIDEDLGLSGSGSAKRSGFARMTAEVALGHVGIVLGLEVSRLARNNADWYRLLDLCGMTDTLIGDSDGLYHPALFNDRLVLGLKGTMSEAELHILRARLDGGIRNKAARGELRRGLPVGFVWGEQDGEVRFHPDEAVVSAIRTVFSKFTEFGSARKVWLWFRSEGLSFPLRANMKSEIRWVTPTYTAIHHVLTNPVYAGAYAYGKCRHERYVDEQGRFRRRTRHLPMAEWPVLLPEHPSSATPGGRRRGERRRCVVAGPGHVWKMWPPVAHPLSRQKRDARLSLLGQGYRPGTRCLLSERRRRPDQSGGGGRLSQSSDACSGGSNRTRRTTTRS
jgi:DNA invertase Pin-like site-specific DNA recombinase